MTAQELLFLLWFAVSVVCILVAAFKTKSWIAASLIAVVALGVGYVMGVIK